jgi:hypothetical protein
MNLDPERRILRPDRRLIDRRYGPDSWTVVAVLCALLLLIALGYVVVATWTSPDKTETTTVPPEVPQKSMLHPDPANSPKSQ